MSTVYVGLSGGVDSAVSAALLKSAGHSVTGAFIKIWQPEFTECTWKEDRLDAMRVCTALEIPFREIDLSEEYKQEVVSDMLKGYERGITPNPDVLCNRHIKFGHFAEWAFSEGAEAVATGHYAQNIGGELHRGKDTHKDQSYFLWQLSKNDLARALFPIGGFTKSEVRALAEKFNLPVAKKPDSQGLCFVGHITMAEFLSRYIPLRPGRVLNEEGKAIGEHDGAALYTLGQRHGFHAESSVPLYVVGINIPDNTITVSSDKMKAGRSRVEIQNVQWVNAAPVFPQKLDAQVRYREQAFPVTVSEKNGKVVVVFAEPVIAAKGQSLVFYKDELLLGGGVIG